MTSPLAPPSVQSRRAFLQTAGLGLGSLALAMEAHAEDTESKTDHEAKT